MKASKKLFALLAVLTMALTLMPMVTPVNAAGGITPIENIEVSSVTWGTLKGFGVDTASTASVVQIKGKLTLNAAVPDIQYLNLLTPSTALINSSTTVPAVGSIDGSGNFIIYANYYDLWNLGAGDGLYQLRYADGTHQASTEVPLTLGKFTVATAVPTEVTSGQKVTITGTVTGMQADVAMFGTGTSATNWKVFVWKDGITTATTASMNIVSGSTTTATFSLKFNAYGDVDTTYFVTYQPATATTYNEAPYFTVNVKDAASIDVTAIPNTVNAGAKNRVSFQFKVGNVALATHNVTGTITLGTKTATFGGTTDANGIYTATVPAFNLVGNANVAVQVSGPNYFGKGSTALFVSTTAEDLLSVVWPDWAIGSANTIRFTTPLSGYTVNSVEVKVSGPVAEDGETLTGTDNIAVTPMGYGVLKLTVNATITNGSDVRSVTGKTFTTAAPISGYVVNVHPTEISRNATVTLTVVVADGLGNRINNAVVTFYSSANGGAIISVDGKATAVNNGTYALKVTPDKITKTDESGAYIQVVDVDGYVVGYVPVKIIPSVDVTVALAKTEIALGPITTVSATVSSPVALQGALVRVYNPDKDVEYIYSDLFAGAGTATVKTVAIPFNTMPQYGAGIYKVEVVSLDGNHMGTATFAFVKPSFTATPAGLVANSTIAVKFTSANVTDLTSVKAVTATGAAKVASFTTATNAITATLVTGSNGGTATVTFKFDSGYSFDMPIIVAYAPLTVANATISVGTKVLTFKPVDAAGAALVTGKAVRINVLGNEYVGYVAADGTVSVLIPELPVGTYTVAVKVDGYQDATFSLVVAKASTPTTPTTASVVIELAVNNDIYTMNGKTMFWDATPYVKNGRTLVPIRALAEALGFQVTYDFSDVKNKTVYIYKAGQDIEKEKDNPYILLVIGQPTAMVNGKLVGLDVAPEILNSRTMVPLRFVSETLGYNVELDGTMIRLSK